MPSRLHPFLQNVKTLIWGSFWNRGTAYAGKVLTCTVLPTEWNNLSHEATASIRGTQKYTASLRRHTQTYKILDHDCTCPAHDSYGDCKHLAGLATYLVNTWKIDHATSDQVTSVREEAVSTVFPDAPAKRDETDIDGILWLDAPSSDDISSTSDSNQWRTNVLDRLSTMTDRERESRLAQLMREYKRASRVVRYTYNERDEQELYTKIAKIATILWCVWTHHAESKKFLIQDHYRDQIIEMVDLHESELPDRQQVDADLEQLKTVEYLWYFDLMNEGQSEWDAALAQVMKEPEYMYSIRLTTSDDDLYPVLIEHKPRKNGGWTVGRKVSPSSIEKKDLPEHVEQIGGLVQNTYNYYSNERFSIGGIVHKPVRFLSLIRKQESLCRVDDTHQQITWWQDDASVIYVLERIENDMYRIRGDISVHGKPVWRDRLDESALRMLERYHHEQTWRRAITNTTDQLYFFQTKAPEALLEKLFWWGITMTPEQFEQFQNTSGFESFVQHLEDKADVMTDIVLPVQQSMLLTIKFDENYQSLTSEVLFYYDDSRNESVALGDFRYYFAPSNAQRYIKNLEGELIGRDFQAERDLIEWVRDFFTTRYEQVDRDAWVAVRPIDATADAFFLALDEEIDAWLPVAYYQKTKKVSNAHVWVTVSVKSGVDRFDTEVSLDTGDMKIDDADLIRDALSRKETLVTLRDGTLLKLREDLIQAKQHLEAMGVDAQKEWSQRLHMAQIWLLGVQGSWGLGGAADYLSFDLDQHAEALRAKIKNFEWIKTIRIPKSVNATLRPYQRTWVNRLHFLQEYGFSGILADDMGLWKTLQAIVMLARHYTVSSKTSNKDISPSLVVCPTSLVYNRYDECEKFCPSLNVSLIRSGKEKFDDPEHAGAQIYIVSYGILTNKVKSGEMDAHMFDHLILDESQHIKNPKSERAKAICLVQSKYRVALSGTPIENNLTELRSVFNFLMPGFLWSLGKFQKQWMVGEPDLTILSKKVKPFILRRTKEEVLTDLPPKVEETIVLEMEPKQRALYTKLEQTYKHEIFSQIQSEGLNKSRFQVLDALLKLRQICLSPALLKLTGNNVTQSAKLTYLKENIEDMLHSGHSLLIFSQFTWFLSKVKDVFDDKKIDYLYLDGQTPSKKRKDLVNQFNAGDARVFIISLKAWGTWLNLVAADYVIHMDPRRNPAVQQQATDRAHRMGQKKTVFVQKLIMKDSIEEKIMQLQEKKKQLIDDVFSGDFSGKLSEDDVQFVFGG